MGERCNRIIIALFGLWPASLFFRMSYSESTFLFFTLLVLYGMFRGWPLPALTLLAGLVTGIRPVGVAVPAALLWQVLSDSNRGSLQRRLLLAVICLPFANWGLLAYMTYQFDQFGTPFAFAQTQQHWSFLAPSEVNVENKLLSLLVGEPIWGIYTSDPVRSWTRIDGKCIWFFSMSFWNPIFFVAAFVLVLVGASKAWLSGAEVVLGFTLLMIPYITRAYEMSMASHARFAAVVIPAYIVLGRLLHVQRRWLTWSVVGILTIFLTVWTALFAAGYAIF